MAHAHIFIRNDDVWTLDKEFKFFFDAAIDHGIPVVHAVIPGKMDKKLIRFLRRAKEKKPALLDIVQHGWMHTNHSGINVPGKKYEFGALRSNADQEKDVLQGLGQMRDAFGNSFTSAFVPPFHGYDQRTWDILCEHGFSILSAGRRKVKNKTGLIELPAKIQFTQYNDDGTYTINKTIDLFTKLVKNINSVPLSGVLTHHENFTTLVSRKELTRFFDQIALSMERNIWRVVLFSHFLKRRNVEKIC